MSYHDGYGRPSGKNKKGNYYDELNFWIEKSKNLQQLLSEAHDHIFDYELLLSSAVLHLEGEGFDQPHHDEVKKFLRILREETGKDK